MHRQGEGFYSVAPHSVRMSEAALLAYGYVMLAYACLHHDDGEFFSGDLIRPLKRLLKNSGDGVIERVDGGIDEAIFIYFDIPLILLPIVKKIDYNIAQDEMTFLLKHQEVLFDYWLPSKAYELFVAQHEKLMILMEYNKKDIVKKDSNGKYES